MMEEVAFMLRSALPIDDIDQLILGPTDGLAVVWVDISERPDLKTLSARHKEEGDGFAICTWFYSNPGKRNMLIGLRIEMRQPTRTVFHLTFNVQRYFDQLSLIGQAGKIWVVPGPPPAHLVGSREMTFQDFLQRVVDHSGHGVMIELEPRLITELHDQLEAWKQEYLA